MATSSSFSTTNDRLFVSCAPYLEPLLVEELQELGIEGVVKAFRGVYVPKTMESVYRINYCSRLATRVLWPLHSFSCRDPKDLYNGARQIHWAAFLTPQKTFAIDANVTHPSFRNSLYAAQVMKDALCDELRNAFGTRPSVNVANPDIQLHLFIDKGKAHISFDTSGMPLYKRGYRQHGAIAPIQESLAAAILRIAHYSHDEILCDPFCGSGTFLIEAAMMASRTPAGFFRSSWGFVHLPEFSKDAWNQVQEEANQKRIALTRGRLIGADSSPAAIELSLFHAKQTGFDKALFLSRKEIENFTPQASPSLIICNPPYGKRLETSNSVYKAIGEFLKNRSLPSCRGFVLSSDTTLLNSIGLPCLRNFTFLNGGSRVSLHAFERAQIKR